MANRYCHVKHKAGPLCFLTVERSLYHVFYKVQKQLNNPEAMECKRRCLASQGYCTETKTTQREPTKNDQNNALFKLCCCIDLALGFSPWPSAYKESVNTLKGKRLFCSRKLLVTISSNWHSCLHSRIRKIF